MSHLYRPIGPLMDPSPPKLPHPAGTTTFYTGSHQPHWLATSTVPLFISHRRLRGRKTFPRALTSWALDSGGFTELSLNGGYSDDAAAYVRSIRRYVEEIGNLAWCAVQDWMCEPGVRQVTGLSIEEHQHRTCRSYLRLRSLWHRAAPRRERTPCLVPVLQGWDLDDYKRHYDMYATVYRIDLEELPLVGVGSVCRRGSTDQIERIIETFPGLNMHGFGVKLTGLDRFGHLLASADSMAWSFAARREPPLPGCTTHKNCANCMRYMLLWRESVLRTIARSRARARDGYQPPLGLFAAEPGPRDASRWAPSPYAPPGCTEPARHRIPLQRRTPSTVR